MIVIEKRKAGRAAFWGVIVYCALDLGARFLASRVAADASALDPHPPAALLLANPNIQLTAILAAALAGYFLPTRIGYPNEDSVGRAFLLAPIVGVIFIALRDEYGFNLDFWSGLQFGFLAAALIPPREDKKKGP